MKIKSLISLILIGILSTSCSLSTPIVSVKTVESAYTETYAPVVTITPFVINLEPGHHYAIPNSLTEKPLVSWKDVPVIPSASAGSSNKNDEGKGYYFLAESTIDETQDFYVREMVQLGWRLDHVVNIMAGSSLDSIQLNFKRNEDEWINITIMPQSEKIMYIILAWVY